MKSPASTVLKSIPVSVIVEPSGRVIRALPPLSAITRSLKSSALPP